MRLVILAVSLVLAVSIPGDPAQAHGPGSPITATGSLFLPAWNESGCYTERYLTDLGFAPHGGDRLQWRWNATSLDTPEVYFELHAHAGTGYVKHFAVTAASDTGSWDVPGSDPYMIFWRNMGNATVVIDYSMTLSPGTDPWVLVVAVAPLLFMGTVVAFAIANRLKRRRAAEEESEGPEGYLDLDPDLPDKL
jgi:hypothetical protein